MAVGSSQQLAKEFMTALVGTMGILILVLQMESLRLWVKVNSCGLVLLFGMGFIGQTSTALSEFQNFGMKFVVTPYKQWQ